MGVLYMEKKLITILVPAYNEQEVLPMLYERLTTLMRTGYQTTTLKSCL